MVWPASRYPNDVSPADADVMDVDAIHGKYWVLDGHDQVYVAR